jgi:ribosomal protein S18 acetylase RimI-like enzyme
MKTCYYIAHESRAACTADLCDYYDEGLILTRINTLPHCRGKGFARTLMREITADADREGITLYLEINASGDMSYDQLAAWYERNGFEDIGGIYRRRPSHTKWSKP